MSMHKIIYWNHRSFSAWHFSPHAVGEVVEVAVAQPALLGLQVQPGQQLEQDCSLARVADTKHG